VGDSTFSLYAFLLQKFTFRELDFIYRSKFILSFACVDENDQNLSLVFSDSFTAVQKRQNIWLV